MKLNAMNPVFKYIPLTTCAVAILWFGFSSLKPRSGENPRRPANSNRENLPKPTLVNLTATESKTSNLLQVQTAVESQSAGDLSRSNSPLERKIRLQLKHASADQALASIATLESQKERRWSTGRISWYKSLAYRLKGDSGKANYWQRVAFESSNSESWADSEFRLQNRRWSNPKSPNHFFVSTHIGMDDGIAETRQTILGMVERIRNLQKIQQEKKGTILDDIDLATWELLLGEYTSKNEEVSLYSTSIENIDSGNDGLSQIELKIEMDPSLEDTISTEPLLAIRLDTARVRSKIFTQAKELSRANEIKRLNQLRTIVRTYRDLTEKLLSWQTYEAVGDSQKASEEAKESLQTLKQIFAQVNEKKDFHLFDEEPVINADDEFKIVQIEPVPFSDDSLSLFKGIKGLAFLKLIQDSNEKNTLLDQAESWANAALDENANIEGLPDAADPSNLLAQMVLGKVSEQRGLEFALDRDPQKREQAKENLQKSKAITKALLDSIKQKGYSDSTIFTQQASRLMNSLQNPNFISGKAWQKAKAGEAESSRELLQEGIKKHLSEAMAVERIRMGLRAGSISPAELLKEWQNYNEIGVIVGNSTDSNLVLSEIANRWAMEILSGKYPEQLEQSKNLLAQSLQSLKKHISDAGDAKPLSIRLKAGYSLGFSLRWALGGLENQNSVPAKPDIEEAYRMARDAEYYLLNELKGTKPEEDDSKRVLLREALISSQLGNAHLSALYLDDWRDESRTFFAAAASEASKLQYTAPILPLIAEPLLRHVFGGDGSDQVRLASEERLRRQMMSRCLEAGYVSYFGLPVEAAKQMNEAVSLAGRFLNKKDNKESAQPFPSASELSLAADGFDAKVSLLDTVRAFGVLENIKAEEYQTALKTAVALASANRLSIADVDALDQKTLQGCLDSIQSPLVGFAFSNALMKVASTLPLEVSIDRKNLLLDYCKRSFKKTEEFLKADRLAARFPHLTTNCQLAIANLETPDQFIRDAQNLVSKRQLSQAVSVAKQGLGLHPQNEVLWRNYFDTQIEIVKSSANKQSLDNFLRELTIVRNNGYTGEFEASYQLAVVSLLKGETQAALNYSNQAVQLAGNGQELTLARSLNARILVSNLSTNLN